MATLRSLPAGILLGGLGKFWICTSSTVIGLLEAVAVGLVHIRDHCGISIRLSSDDFWKSRCIFGPCDAWSRLALGATAAGCSVFLCSDIRVRLEICSCRNIKFNASGRRL